MQWYWNIAPEYDATCLPTWYSERGARLDSEFGYLSPFGRGVFTADYLPDDVMAQPQGWAAHRTSVSVAHLDSSCDRRDTDALSREHMTEVDLAAAEADAATPGHHDGLIG